MTPGRLLRRRCALPALLALAALAASACAPPVAIRVRDAVEAYERGEYPAAMDRFVESEGELGNQSPEVQARYLVFRGLAAFHLGRKAEARTLLTKGKRAYDAGDPRWLSPAVATEMNKALSELGGS